MEKVLFLEFPTKESADKARKTSAYVGLGAFLLSTAYCFATKQKVVKSIAIVGVSNILATSVALGTSYLINK